jgi:hypothetical protein
MNTNEISTLRLFERVFIGLSALHIATGLGFTFSALSQNSVNHAVSAGGMFLISGVTFGFNRMLQKMRVAAQDRQETALFRPAPGLYERLAKTGQADALFDSDGALLMTGPLTKLKP